jgi:hypothetical protein
VDLKLGKILNITDDFVRFEVFTAVTMKNVVFWYVSTCGSYRNLRFGGTYCLNHQGENNQQTKDTLAIASDCSKLRNINHYMQWDKELSPSMHFRYRGYDRPLFWDEYYRKLLIWEITMIAKYDMYGLVGRGTLSDRLAREVEMV